MANEEEDSDDPRSDHPLLLRDVVPLGSCEAVHVRGAIRRSEHSALARDSGSRHRFRDVFNRLSGNLGSDSAKLRLLVIRCERNPRQIPQRGLLAGDSLFKS